MSELTIFYDGYCPLCVKEMDKLKHYDTQQRIQLIDIHTQAFKQFPTIDPIKASNILHGITKDNTLILGLDVTHAAWSLVGKGWIYAPLRWPLVRVFADRCYLWFARNRYTISKWLTGSARCSNGQCK